MALNVGDIVLTVHQLRRASIRPAIVLEVVNATTAHVQQFEVDGSPVAAKNCPVFATAQLAAAFIQGGGNFCCFPKP